MSTTLDVVLFALLKLRWHEVPVINRRNTQLLSEFCIFLKRIFNVLDIFFDEILSPLLTAHNFV